VCGAVGLVGVGVVLLRHDETDDDSVWQTVFEKVEGKGRTLIAFAVVFVFVFATDYEKVTESFFDRR